MAPNLDMNRSASTDGEEPEFYAEPSSSWWYGGGSAVVPGWNNDWVDMFSWTESSEPVDYIDVIGSSVVEGWLRWAGIAAYEDYHQAVVGYIHDRTHDLANSFDQYGDHWLERHDLPGQQEFPMGVSCSPSFYCHNFLTWAHTYIWNWP